MGTLYEHDIVAWSVEQAALLRSGRLAQLDLEHIAEEIEDVGISVQRSLASRCEVLIRHLMKWAFQPERRSNSWLHSIKSQRRSIMRLVHKTPSLRHVLEDSDWLAEEWEDALGHAYMETGLDHLPEEPIWSMAQILDPEFFPD